MNLSKINTEDYPDSFEIGRDKIKQVWSAATSLRILDIGLHSALNRSSADVEDYSIEASEFLFESLFDRDGLPPLTDLCLSHFAGPSTRLLRVLQRQLALRKLHLYKFYLTGGTWIEIFDGIRDLHLILFRLDRVPEKQGPHRVVRYNGNLKKKIII